VYWIHFENRSPHVVLLRLLVDGRNTLPEEVQAKEVRVEAVERKRRLAADQTVSLAEARHWHIEPGKGDGEPGRLYAIQGFYSEVGEAGTYREFTVASAPESLTERERFGDQLGLITAAFYAPKGGARGLMTVPGKEQQQKLRMYKATDLGDLLAVVNIHYVEPEALEAAKGQGSPSTR
jgi:hypothetical protein